MAAHASYPPSGAEAMVRGDPAAWVVRFQIGGVDQDITGWDWRCYVRTRIDGEFVTECETFEVAAPVDLADLFPGDPSAVPCVLILRWTEEQTAQWSSGYVSDIEQMAPAKRTWLIIDSLRLDKDVSYEVDSP